MEVQSRFTQSVQWIPICLHIIYRLHLELSKSGACVKIFDKMASKGYLKGKIDLSGYNIDSKDISAKRGDTGYDSEQRLKE